MDISKVLLLLPLLLTACTSGADTVTDDVTDAPVRSETSQDTDKILYEYGVFLGLDRDDIGVMESYRTIVLDAQYFTAEDIQSLKRSGHTVYSYINAGALEDFRPYYKDYEIYTLDVYENWEEERWVDVSAPKWQAFMSDLAGELMSKGCDGLFVDNVDVYYHYHDDKTFDGITAILSGFKDMGAYVSINGGDVYVTEYADRYGKLDIMDAENQETVFSSIDFGRGTFSSNDEEERRYFMDYIERVGSMGKD
ncbi:MAG: endo alpha-1,4 polygalactosaminidase, partial [Oscillospiraceae bacterium]|nr:endo alpha-1,4 polygalactosaminidase [Oscillospiraceae bacterium]